MIRTGASATSWKDTYKLLVTSLQASSVHFQRTSFDTLIVGLWGLSSKHSSAQAPSLPGKAVEPSDRSLLAEWVYCADVLLRIYDGPTTPAAVARSLGVEECCVLHLQPESAPLLPAHAVIVDHERKQLLLLVRGTSSWADCLTDLVAHTEPLGTGHAHSGMLDCARTVLQHCVPLLQEQLQQTPGYRIHCMGHSLGGGVAALAATLIRSSPEWRQQLQQASGVVATGFGTPPVMTQDLAESASAYIRTLVHDCDLVPRTCVASLALLRTELEAARDEIYNSNALLASLKSSGILDGGASLLGNLATTALANKLVPTGGGSGAAKSRWVAAGLQVGASMLLKAKQLHEEAMTQQAAPPPAQAQGGSNSSSHSAAPTSGSCNGNSNGSGLSSAVQQPAGAAAAGGGVFNFAAVRQAMTAAAATAVGGSQVTQQQPQQPQPSQQPQQQQQQQQGLAQKQQQQQPGPSGEGSRSPMPQSQQQRYEEEEAAAQVCLYCPGQLWHLRREAGGPTDGDSEDCPYTLVRAEQPGAARFGGQIWVKGSMLRDHYLTVYISALLRLQAQLVEQAAMQAV